MSQLTPHSKPQFGQEGQFRFLNAVTRQASGSVFRIPSSPLRLIWIYPQFPQALGQLSGQLSGQLLGRIPFLLGSGQLDFYFLTGG